MVETRVFIPHWYVYVCFHHYQPSAHMHTVHGMCVSIVTNLPSSATMSLTEYLMASVSQGKQIEKVNKFCVLLQRWSIFLSAVGHLVSVLSSVHVCLILEPGNTYAYSKQ